MCSICNTTFNKKIERIDFQGVKQEIKDNYYKIHFHYGMNYYLYGICPKYHLTKLEKIKTIWIKCNKCYINNINSNVEKLKNDLEKIKLSISNTRNPLDN